MTEREAQQQIELIKSELLSLQESVKERQAAKDREGKPLLDRVASRAGDVAAKHVSMLQEPDKYTRKRKSARFGTVTDVLREDVQEPGIGDYINAIIEEVFSYGKERSEKQQARREAARVPDIYDPLREGRIVPGVARLGGGMVGWMGDLATNPPKAVIDLVQSVVHGTVKWGEVADALRGNEDAKQALKDELKNYPVETVATFFMPIAGVLGLRAVAKGMKAPKEALSEGSKRGVETPFEDQVAEAIQEKAPVLRKKTEVPFEDQVAEAIQEKAPALRKKTEEAKIREEVPNAEEVARAGEEILQEARAKAGDEAVQEVRVRDVDRDAAKRRFKEETIGKEPQAAKEVVPEAAIEGAIQTRPSRLVKQTKPVPEEIPKQEFDIAAEYNRIKRERDNQAVNELESTRGAIRIETANQEARKVNVDEPPVFKKSTGGATFYGLPRRGNPDVVDVVPSPLIGMTDNAVGPAAISQVFNSKQFTHGALAVDNPKYVRVDKPAAMRRSGDTWEVVEKGQLTLSDKPIAEPVKPTSATGKADPRQTKEIAVDWIDDAKGFAEFRQKYAEQGSETIRVTNDMIRKEKSAGYIRPEFQSAGSGGLFGVRKPGTSDLYDVVPKGGRTWDWDAIHPGAVGELFESASFEKIPAGQGKFNYAPAKKDLGYARVIEPAVMRKTNTGWELVEKGKLEFGDKPMSATGEAIAKIREERAKIKKQIDEFGSHMHDVIGATLEGGQLLGKLILNYAKEGVVRLQDLVDRIRADHPKIRKSDIYKAVRDLDDGQLSQPIQMRVGAWRSELPPPPKARAKLSDEYPDLARADLEVDAHLEYMKEISQPLPTRTFKEDLIGKQPEFAGTEKGSEFLVEDIFDWPHFKEISEGILGGSKSPDYFIAEIDGAIPLGAKAKLLYQAGPLERGVYWRQQDMQMQQMRWSDAQSAFLGELFDGVPEPDLVAITGMLSKINRKTSYINPDKLSRWNAEGTGTLDASPQLIAKTQKVRQWLEHIYKQQNRARELRGQEPIKHRDRYNPQIIRKMSAWEQVFGHDLTPADIMRSQGLPDFVNIVPNKPFNPRELAQRGLIPKELLEDNIKTLCESIANTAARDIFHTSIIQNNKAYSAFLRDHGYPASATALENWTAESFGGVPPYLTRGTTNKLPPRARKVAQFSMMTLRQGYNRTAFPLNVKWNTTIQTTSSALTVGKYGIRNSIAATFDWFGNPELRGEISKTYTMTMKGAGRMADPTSLFPKIKGRTVGSITQQDVNTGSMRMVQVDKGKLDTATDYFNYMTEATERTLTGWSIAAALRHGRAAGLKGEALWRYASDAGGKTQGMYNYEYLPGILRSSEVKTLFPYQTFSFNLFNYSREWMGLTGTPPASQAARIGTALRFVGTTTAINWIVDEVTGRKPFSIDSFVPFYMAVFENLDAAIRGERLNSFAARGQNPAPTSIGIEFAWATRSAFKGNLKPARQWLLRNVPGWFGVPGGTQANRLVDGIMAIVLGEVADKNDRTLFDVEGLADQVRAVYGGPWATSEGLEYLKERRSAPIKILPNEEDSFLELIGNKDIRGIGRKLLTETVEHIPVIGDVIGREE